MDFFRGCGFASASPKRDTLNGSRTDYGDKQQKEKVNHERRNCSKPERRTNRLDRPARLWQWVGFYEPI